jgi:hypothetical protein
MVFFYKLINALLRAMGLLPLPEALTSELFFAAAI